MLFVTGSQPIACTKIYRTSNNLACDQRENDDKATKQAFTNFFWMGARNTNLSRYQNVCMVNLANHMSTISIAA